MDLLHGGIKGDNLAVHREFPDSPPDELSILRAKIQNQDGFAVNGLAPDSKWLYFADFIKYRTQLPNSTETKSENGGVCPEADMNYYLLFYHTVDGYVEKRAPFRNDHLRLVREAHGRGELIMAGALADPVDQAVLVFRAPDTKVIEEFVRNDPYVQHGLITQWEIRAWTVVVP